MHNQIRCVLTGGSAEHTSIRPTHRQTVTLAVYTGTIKTAHLIGTTSRMEACSALPPVSMYLI